MFTWAKLKLTLLYLSILLTITGVFSLALYKFVNLEVLRGFERIELEVARNYDIPTHIVRKLITENVRQAQGSVAIGLLYINIFIALIAGIASYILASKTLLPIEESVEEQKRFVADASHELRTPLTALKTNLEVTLRDRSLNTKTAKEAIKNALIDIGDIEKLTNSLLDLSSIQDLRENLPCEPTDVKELLKKSISKFEGIANKKGVKITLKAKASVLICNIESLNKLFEIIIDNSIKYTSKGGSLIITLKESKRKITVSFKDTGKGIEKQDLPFVFDRFYRSDNARSNSSGYGLGLSIAKRIVDLHNGTIEAASESEKGTTILVTLPKGNSKSISTKIH